MAVDARSPNLLRDVPAAVWIAAAVLLLSVAVIVHGVFPRYEWRMVDTDGTVIIVYDRWAGRFQRAIYQEDGSVRGMSVYRPF